MKTAQEAQSRGDWKGAEHCLAQACDFAESNKGAMMNRVALISKQQKAETLYRAGELDRAADLSFELIQVYKGPG